jgi:pectate lyase
MDIENARYVWVHHNDIFYGLQGTGDNFKGDGSVDIKISSYVPVSYNHFWDSGKVMLLGNARTEPRGFITYHNNHFDHSDSRHPRTRVHDAHVFNNFYDNIGTYGIGATSGSSLFAESNFFRNTRRPMMISLQGTDIINGENNGTFSSDPGGIIKAYNNHIEGGTIVFSPWSASNQIQFDAYVVQNRMDAVPETVITRVGGHTYSNFDLNLPYTYTALSPAEVKENVKRYAGRYWGGDIGATIPFAFVQADAASGTRNAQLDNILSGYQSKLVSIQGITASP